MSADVLRSVDAVPAHVAGRFRDPAGFQQSASGQYFVFDRRSHIVYGIDESRSSAWQIVHIGNEAGRIIDPTAFAVAPDGTFVVADAPDNQERIQVFTPGRVPHRRLHAAGPHARPRRPRRPGAERHRLASVHGTSILISQPETGALVTEYSLAGKASRSFGTPGATGHEDDPTCTSR